MIYVLYLIFLIEILQPRHIHFAIRESHSENCIKYEKNSKMNNLGTNKTMPLKSTKKSVSSFI